MSYTAGKMFLADHIPNTSEEIVERRGMVRRVVDIRSALRFVEHTLKISNKVMKVSCMARTPWFAQSQCNASKCDIFVQVSGHAQSLTSLSEVE